MGDRTLSSRSYQSRHKSHFETELFIDFDEVNEDYELKTAYPCPFCADDFDLVELCCHIDLDHSMEEAKSGICPICAVWVATNMVDHIGAQHGNLFKISFLLCLIKMLLFIIILRFPFVSFLPTIFYCLFYLFFFVLHSIQIYTSFTGNYSLRKPKCYKRESCPEFPFKRKGHQDGHSQSYSASFSPVMSTSTTARDKFLSFIDGAPAVDKSEYLQLESEVSIEEVHSDDKVLKRDVQLSLSDKDQVEEALRSEFVQGLLMSTFLDPDF